MFNSNMIEIKFMGPTNTLGSRIRFRSFDFRHKLRGKAKIKVVSYNYTFNNINDQAEAILKKYGFKVIGCNDRHPEHTVFLVEWDWELMCRFFKIKE